MNKNYGFSIHSGLFFTLEKAREIRVFNPEAEMLDFQSNIDQAIAQFNEALGILTVISNARTFINVSTAGDDVKNSFNAIIDEAEAFINAVNLDYSEIDAVKTRIENTQNFVEAIVAADTYGESLAELDLRLGEGLTLSMDAAKNVLVNSASDASAFATAKAHLEKHKRLLKKLL